MPGKKSLALCLVDPKLLRIFDTKLLRVKGKVDLKLSTRPVPSKLKVTKGV